MDIYRILRESPSTPLEELEHKYWKMVDSYQLVVDFADDPEVASIAQRKLDQLVKAGQPNWSSRSPDLQFPVSEQADLLAIKLALNSKHSLEGSVTRRRLEDRISNLPESAEKHYLSSILILKTMRGIDGCIRAAAELANAIERDPRNIAYKNLAEALNEQINLYEARLQEEHNAAEAERLVRQQTNQQVLDKARKDGQSTICEGLLVCGGMLGLTIWGCVSVCNGTCICCPCSHG